jgi:hypothetical protein
MTIKVIEEAIRATKEEVIIGKIDWSDSPFLDVKKLGKNSVAAFGEHLYDQQQKRMGLKSKVVRVEHDVIVGQNKKTEVKTAFQNKAGTFFFNQIRYFLPEDHERAGEQKDWNHLAFVFVKPHSVEIWECERPSDPKRHFRWNNDWSWQGKNEGRGKKLCPDTWIKVYEHSYK